MPRGGPRFPKEGDRRVRQQGPARRVHLRLSADLLDKVDAKAASRLMGRSAWIEEAISFALAVDTQGIDVYALDVGQQ